MELSDLVYIDETGYHYADYPAFLAFVQARYRAIYGEDIYIEPDSQDGQNLAVEAKSMYDTAALGAAVYNSFSPVTAQGTGLSRNVKINGLNRRAATNSTVDLTIVGVTGTTITNGVAIDTLGQKWDLPASVTIPGGGTTVVTATAQDVGALQAAINTVNQIFTPTLGWQTVNNATAASAGEPVETDAELRVRQAISTANPSLTVFDGTIGAVANLDGVTDVKGYENDTASTDSNGIPEHSICVVVAGGDSEEIAQTIALHKTPGTGTYGDTSEIVYDAHGMPLTIEFQRPDPVTIICEVTIGTGPDYSSDYEDLIKDAIAEQIEAFGIGSIIVLSKLYGPAYLFGTAAGQTYTVASIQIAEDGDPLGNLDLTLDFDQQPICTAADVNVVVA